MLVIAVLATTLLIVIAGAVSNSRSVPSRGTVKKINLGVYWDSGCTNATATVYWGMLSPGTLNNVTLNLRNEGNLAVKLNLTAQNWNPLNTSNYMRLTWNREGQALSPGTVAPATLTLSVFANTSGITDFSFDIVIAGLEQ